jgi:hypothetical protein
VEALRLTVECALREYRFALHREDSGDRRTFHRAATGGENHRDHQQGLSESYWHDLSGS